MKNEFEAKFLCVNKERTRASFKAAGFQLKTPECTMRRKTFDLSSIAPGRNKWGRVRQEADRVTMTVKEVLGSSINDTYEVEITVNDFDAATAFLEACNIPAKSLQENMREVWVRADIEVTIDTWPGLNPFVEIEGESEHMVRVAASELGFDFEESVFGGIDVVYEKELGIPPATLNRLPQIAFAVPPTPSDVPKGKSVDTSEHS
jgi:adenylate cyclase, class 2